MSRLAVTVALAALAWTCGRASAQPKAITVGMYAPSAPFQGPAESLEYVSVVGAQLARIVGAPSGVGRNYGRAVDFQAAVRGGELDFAIADAAYLGARGTSAPGKPLAVATHHGATATAWQIVAETRLPSLLALRGKTIVVPDVGARPDAFLYQVLLGGELGKGYFGRVVSSPDALSAALAVSLGRADAAVVPAGIRLPERVRRIAEAAHVSWPILVALPHAGATQIAAVQQAIQRIQGRDLFEGFTPVGPDAPRALAARFARPEHRGPMAVPALRLPPELLRAHSFEIPELDVAVYASVP
jgi:hypothetical protein